MALKISKILNNGIDAQECYVKVICLEKRDILDLQTREKIEKTVVTVVLYYSEEARLENKQSLGTKHYTVDQKLNSFEDAYNYLKTLDEYQGAIDV